jgi:cytochrome o ubiquinol oxidase subunit 2
MRYQKKFVGPMLFFTGVILFLILLMQPLSIYHLQNYISVLFPAGRIGIEERNLLLIIQGVMLLVIIPVYILTFIFSWKYRADNPDHEYDPDLVDNTFAEVVWWGLPLLLTIFIAVLTTYYTYALDPFTPIQSEKKTKTIQVVALQWKWLFIYPEEKIASVNFLQIPKDTPIRFEITADAPMNSFWIPQLGGQIYAMPKMKTELNLIANKEGDFRGSSANISGVGFSGMHFITRASSDEDYDRWIQSAKAAENVLTNKTYQELAKPSSNNASQAYRLEDENLFDSIVNYYMYPQPK